MKFSIRELPYGFYTLIKYKTFFGFPYGFRFSIHQTMDECLDHIVASKKADKQLSIDELMKEKERLQSELDRVTRLLREKVLKTKI